MAEPMLTNHLRLCHLAAFCGALLLMIATGASAKAPGPAKTVVYYNGRVLTMEGDTPRYAQAVVVKGTRIAFVGGQKQALALAGAHAERHDLKGHVMVPGFIDTWGHFALVAQNTLGVNLAYFGENPPHTKAQLIEKMQKEGRPFNGWLLGSGYSEAMLSDGAPSLEELDRAFPSTPLLLQDISTLTGKVNSAGLRALGITTETKATAGFIVKDPKTGQLTGDLIGQPFLTAVAKAVGTYPQSVTFDTYRKAEQMVVQMGYTTCQSYESTPQEMADMRAAVDRGTVKIDLIALPTFSDVDKMLKSDPNVRFGVYNHKDHGFKIAGMQVPTDGASQLRLGYFSQPYIDTTGFPAGWRGFSFYPQATIDKYVRMAYDRNIQLFGYSNGDAGIDMMLAAMDKAEAACGAKGDRRSVIAHSIFVRDDQLARYRKKHLIAAMMPTNGWLYGDVYMQTLGAARATRTSPAQKAVAAGVTTVLHCDCPSSGPSVMASLWCAVTRKTLSGKVLGPKLDLAPYQGLLGFTRNAAFMYHEEGLKGTITAGKLADLVVLDKNPLTVSPDAIKDIAVLETVKSGRTIYRKP